MLYMRNCRTEQVSRAWSYNYVNLAHAISYVAVANSLVSRFIFRSSATIVMTGCSVHSEVLHFFYSRWLYLDTDIYFVGPLGILSLCTGCIRHVLSYQAQAWSRTRIQSTCQWQLEMINVIPQNSVEFIYLSTSLIPDFGLAVLIISTTKRIALPCTLDSRCIAVIYDKIMRTA